MHLREQHVAERRSTSFDGVRLAGTGVAGRPRRRRRGPRGSGATGTGGGCHGRARRGLCGRLRGRARGGLRGEPAAGFAAEPRWASWPSTAGSSSPAFQAAGMSLLSHSIAPVGPPPFMLRSCSNSCCFCSGVRFGSFRIFSRPGGNPPGWPAESGSNVCDSGLPPASFSSAVIASRFAASLLHTSRASSAAISCFTWS